MDLNGCSDDGHDGSSDTCTAGGYCHVGHQPSRHYCLHRTNIVTTMQSSSMCLLPFTVLLLLLASSQMAVASRLGVGTVAVAHHQLDQQDPSVGSHTMSHSSNGLSSDSSSDSSDIFSSVRRLVDSTSEVTTDVTASVTAAATAAGQPQDADDDVVSLASASLLGLQSQPTRARVLRVLSSTTGSTTAAAISDHQPELQAALAVTDGVTKGRVDGNAETAGRAEGRAAGTLGSSALAALRAVMETMGKWTHHMHVIVVSLLVLYVKNLVGLCVGLAGHVLVRWWWIIHRGRCICCPALP